MLGRRVLRRGLGGGGLGDLDGGLVGRRRALGGGLGDLGEAGRRRSLPLGSVLGGGLEALGRGPGGLNEGLLSRGEALGGGLGELDEALGDLGGGGGLFSRRGSGRLSGRRPGLSLGSSLGILPLDGLGKVQSRQTGESASRRGGAGRGSDYSLAVDQGRERTVPAQSAGRWTPRKMLKRLGCLRADDKVEFIHIARPSDAPTLAPWNGPGVPQ